jgi:hypothetical protein
MRSFAILSLLTFLTVPSFPSAAAQEPRGRKEFPPGLLRRSEDLPAGRLREQIERLPAQARERAVNWLANSHFTTEDLVVLQADAEGGIFYADEFKVPPVQQEAAPPTAEAAVPVSPFPTEIIFHSKRGAPNVLYLNFAGETVTGTSWNDSVGRISIPAVAFSTDADYSTFSDSERLAIRRIWQRVAEDYAAFDIDVTTERPATFTTRTAHALITRSKDANGMDNPASGSGGVAYLGVFGTVSYSRYRPAWIYSDNLAGEESYIAEAASHEIGHNLGLSHDGTTNGSDYYGGHGSGETSWGPLMGTGYNRNLSQWSKGEYYQANNTQDDLATIASKLTYRTDDHDNTFSAATPLVVSSGGAISSTTPETDPQNSSPANKGVIERNTDVDAFSFATGSGPITLRVNPWIVPAGRTRGGNTDLVAQLYNSSGQVLATANVATTAGATVQTTLNEGVYYLVVRTTGVGYPTDPIPSGYTSYGCIGQYFISGTVVYSTTPIPPGAQLNVTDISEPGVGAKTFTVIYSDNSGINVSTIGNNDVRVVGPNGYSQAATLVSIDQNSNGTPRTATYSIVPPSGNNGTWGDSDEGTYTISMLSNTVADSEGLFVPAGTLGTFRVDVPLAIYVASMDSNPGWTFEGLWEYGPPRYVLTGPLTGATGLNIIGYNLGGNYENRLAATYATTPAINCSGATSVTLRFQRYLRLKSGDVANVQFSTDGIAWNDLWSTSSTIADTSWQPVQYTLPGWAAGSPALRLRWGLTSGQTQNDIGWNIDDVVLLVNGALDTTAPVAAANVGDITAGDLPTHSFTVTYSDDTAVRVSTIGSGDLYVVGPNGFSNVVEFTGVDAPSDGTPRTASYSVAAPGGSWESSDNGEYVIYLREGEVTDTANNSVPSGEVARFFVAIAQAPARSQPQIASISKTAFSYVVTVNGTAGAQHVLEATANMSAWSAVATNTPDSATFVFEDSAVGEARFYRVTIR